MSYSKEVIVPKAGTRRATMLMSFRSDVEAADQTIAKFTKGMAEDPVYTLQWAADSFNAAAKRDVANQVICLLERVEDVEGLRIILLEGVMNKAQYINNKSTSTCSNFMEECVLAARTEAYDCFKYVKTLD